METGGVADYVETLINNGNECYKRVLYRVGRHQTVLTAEVLLHYSGYGYAKRGAPLWLLNKVQTDRPYISSLGIFFHELYAFGFPWGSAFWLSPVQRHIARRLAEMSDFWITNREGSAQWLRRFAGNKPSAVLPVFFNVGEMPAYSPVRASKIVVFGSASLRMATYRAAGSTLFSWAREHELELHNIGPVINDPILPSALRNAGVRQHGRLEAAEVSKQLSAEVCLLIADHDPQSQEFKGRSKPLTIQYYDFVGTRAVLLPGVTLNRGCVVCAGAVVTNDVAENTIVAGVPARIIGTREIELCYTIDYGRLPH